MNGYETRKVVAVTLPWRLAGEPYNCPGISIREELRSGDYGENDRVTTVQEALCGGYTNVEKGRDRRIGRVRPVNSRLLAKDSGPSWGLVYGYVHILLHPLQSI